MTAHRLGHVREALADPRFTPDTPLYVRVVDRSRNDGPHGSYHADEYPITGGMTGWEDGHASILADAPPAPLTFAEVSAVSRARAARWHPGFPDDDQWSGSDWSNAMCGEAGEAANVVKKLRRVECGLVGALDKPEAELRAALAHELADVYLYLDLLAAKYDVDLPAAIVEKFNIVSELQGFPERLRPVSGDSGPQ